MRDQYVGEELDWKMLADNLTMFGSQMQDLEELRGLDDKIGGDINLDQSIVVNNAPH